MPSSYQEVRQVCFVGAGTMGCFNALMAGSAGLTCTVVDKSAIALDGFEDRLRATGDYLCHQGLFSAPELSNALSMIAVVADLAEAVTGADLISESVPEQLALKKDVLGSLDRPLRSAHNYYHQYVLIAGPRNSRGRSLTATGLQPFILILARGSLTL